VTNRLAAEEIGMPRSTKITPAALKEAKKPHNAVYQEIGNLGPIATGEEYKAEIAGVGRSPGKSFPGDVNPDIQKLRESYAVDNFDSKDAVLKVRQLRAASSKNIKAPNAPERNELGYAQRQIADAIENQMERHAVSVGQTDLVERFKASRQALAKIHSVEGALVGNTGDVSAVGLAKQMKRGAPLTGNLRTIADVANEFGEAMRDATKLKNKVPITVLEGGAGVVGAGLTAASHPLVGGAALGGMIARPAVRKFLLSDMYQNKLGAGPRDPLHKPTIDEIESTQ
jgi:hypothetical protein